MDALAHSASQLGVSPNIYTSRQPAKMRTGEPRRHSPHNKRSFGAAHGPYAYGHAAASSSRYASDPFGTTPTSLDFSSVSEFSPLRMGNFSAL